MPVGARPTARARKRLARFEALSQSPNKIFAAATAAIHSDGTANSAFPALLALIVEAVAPPSGMKAIRPIHPGERGCVIEIGRVRF